MRRHFERSSLIGKRPGYHSLGTTNTAGYIFAIVALVVAVIGVLIWAIVVTVDLNRPPKLFSPETVPENVNQLFKDYYEDFMFGQDALAIYPNSAARYGYVPAYTQFNATARLWYLDEPIPFSTTFDRIRPRLEGVLNTNKMSNAQKRAAREILGRRNYYDVWRYAEMPQKCIKGLEAIDNINLNPTGALFRDAQIFSLVFSSPNLREQDFGGVHAIYDDITFNSVVQNLDALTTLMYTATNTAFYERQNAWLISNYGVSFPDVLAFIDIGDTIEALIFLTDPSDFGGGSSGYYNSVVIRVSQTGYALSSAQDVLLRTAIENLDTALIALVNYQLAVLDVTVLLFDTSLGTYSPMTYWVKQWNNNYVEECILPSLAVFSKDPATEYHKLRADYLAQRAIAEPIYISEIGDYLGWNLTWVHVFFGTEAAVTDLGWYAPTDCPGGAATTDPAYLQTGEYEHRVRSVFSDIGTIGNDHTATKGYFGNYFGGCDADFGNAFVTWNQGDHLNKRLTSMFNGPMQPKDDGTSVIHHETVHVNQLNVLAGACPTCYMYRLGRIPFDGFLSAAIEGYATYSENRPLNEDVRYEFTDLERAANAILRMLVRLEAPIPAWGLRTGEAEIIEVSSFLQENNWFPYTFFEDQLGFSETFRDYYLGSQTGLFFYTGGSFRYEELRDKIINACPEHVRRVHDAAMIYPASLTVAEVAIDEFIASGCKEWPYEQHQTFR